MQERLIEELTLNAWPAAGSLLLDGWVLCFSGGYTRRANSVHPLYPSVLPVENKIRICQQSYAIRGMATVFKLTSSPADADLDRTLARRGYEFAALTSVQTANLSEFAARRPEVDPAVQLSTTLQDPWFAAFNGLAVVPESVQSSERRLLESIIPPHAFASLALGGQTVAVGLAVAERGHVGLFNLVVDANHRNAGLARRLCTSLLAWAQGQSAQTAYLAVVPDNAPAQAVYAKLGFKEQYRYWYRIHGATSPDKAARGPL